MAYATTSKGRESTSQTVARAKKMLSSSLKKTGGSVKKSDGSGLSQKQIDQLKGASGIDQNLLSNYEKNQRAITPDSFKDTPAIDIPKPVAPTAVPDTGIINASLGQTDAGGMFTPIATQAGDSESVAAAKDASNTTLGYLQSVLPMLKGEDGANEKALIDARREAGVRQAQEEYNRYQNQINAITAKRDAQMLGLEGQGRGITDTIIGGQQARISREAAIMAMPIQAQLAAAQGNLEQAKELMGQLYQAKSADIQADQTYRTNLVNSVMGWANTAQSNILQAKLSDISQRAQTAQANLAYQRQLGLQALEYGQNGLITGISSIDPNSPTFEQDIAAYTAQLRKPVTTTTKAPTLQNFGTSDNPIWKQYDYATGEWVDVAGVAGASTPQQAVKLSMGQQQLDLIGSILGSNAMDSAVGTSIFSRGAGTTGGVMGRLLAGGAAGATVGATAGLAGGPLAPITSTMGAVGGGVIGAGLAALQGSKDTLITGERQNFIANVDQLTAKLTNAELIKAKAAGATYGALGVKEQQLLENAATKINNWAIHEGGDPEAPVIGYNTSEKNMKAELDNIAYYTKLDYVLSGGDPNIVGASQQPDGTWWIVNSDGSARQLQLEY